MYFFATQTNLPPARQPFRFAAKQDPPGIARRTATRSDLLGIHRQVERDPNFACLH
jgi:hypothetical protein